VLTVEISSLNRSFSPRGMHVSNPLSLLKYQGEALLPASQRACLSAKHSFLLSELPESIFEFTSFLLLKAARHVSDLGDKLHEDGNRFVTIPESRAFRRISRLELLPLGRSADECLRLRKALWLALATHHTALS